MPSENTVVKWIVRSILLIGIAYLVMVVIVAGKPIGRMQATHSAKQYLEHVVSGKYE